MEVNRKNIKISMNHILGQWEFYWKMIERFNEDTFIEPKGFKYKEGDMIYIQLEVGYPHELVFGHWCYVLRKIGNKLLVIPSVTPRGKPSRWEMDIHAGSNVSRLSFSDIRAVDKQRIDARKKPRKVKETREYIFKKFREEVKI